MNSSDITLREYLIYYLKLAKKSVTEKISEYRAKPEFMRLVERERDMLDLDNLVILEDFDDIPKIVDPYSRFGFSSPLVKLFRGHANEFRASMLGLLQDPSKDSADFPVSLGKPQALSNLARRREDQQALEKWATEMRGEFPPEAQHLLRSALEVTSPSLKSGRFIALRLGDVWAAWNNVSPRGAFLDNHLKEMVSKGHGALALAFLKGVNKLDDYSELLTQSRTPPGASRNRSEALGQLLMLPAAA